MGYEDFRTTPLFEGLSEAEISQRKSPIEMREAALNGSPVDRAEFTRHVSVNVDEYRKANRFIDKLIGRSSRTDRPGGLWILGEGGVGKTFILDSVYQRYQPIENRLERKCPILSLQFSGRPSESDIMLTLLLQMGQSPELLRYNDNAELQKILLKAFQACGALGILFDEAHHLWLTTHIKRVADRPGGRTGDFLKSLYDKSGLAYIFTGKEGLGKLVESDTQINTRWSGVLRITSFENDAKFRGLLNALDEALPMPQKSGLATEQIASRLFAATKGNFRSLKDLLAEAVFIASSENSPKVVLKHLANAYFGVFCDETTPFGPADA